MCFVNTPVEVETFLSYPDGKLYTFLNLGEGKKSSICRSWGFSSKDMKNDIKIHWWLNGCALQSTFSGVRVSKRRDDLLNSEAEAVGRVRGLRGQEACRSRCVRHLTMTVICPRGRKTSLCKQRKTSKQEFINILD